MKLADPTARSGTGCVYRPVVTGRRNGKKTSRKSRFYWAKYRANSGRVVRHAMKLPNGNGICDKTVAQAELRRIQIRLEREAVGLIDPFVESATITAVTAAMVAIEPLWMIRPEGRKVVARSTGKQPTVGASGL